MTADSLSMLARYNCKQLFFYLQVFAVVAVQLLFSGTLAEQTVRSTSDQTQSKMRNIIATSNYWMPSSTERFKERVPKM